MKRYEIKFKYAKTNERGIFRCSAETAYEARKKFQRQLRSYWGRRILLKLEEIEYTPEEAITTDRTNESRKKSTQPPWN